MTPEERAQSVIEGRGAAIRSGDGSMLSWVALLARAIRAAENEALERAARVADDDVVWTMKVPVRPSSRVGAAIRALKHPEDK